MKLKDNDLVYAKSNLVIEPLVDNWYAWPHLISPATAALNIKERHLKIMDSYVKNPQVHSAAVKNPKMLGGPFIDYNGKRVEEIDELRTNTIKLCSELFELCDNISELNRLLELEAKGYSLTSLYSKVPIGIRGLVEIYYDLNNNASYRFFESLLYKSKYYKEILQSFNLFLVNDDDTRSFVLSTPRLKEEGILRFNVPFKDQRIDEIFETTSRPKMFGKIKGIFNIEPDDHGLFQTFFTKDKPEEYKNYHGNGVLTRYFGHACVLVESKNTAILVDPVISYGYESDLSRFTYSDLPEKIDYVFFTHNHQDHILFETLLRIRKRINKIVIPKSANGELQNPSLKLILEYVGFNNIIELGELETIEFEDCTITGIPFLGEHSDLNVQSKLCHLVEFSNGYKMMFAADSCNVERMVYERVQDVVGNVDILFLGMECDGAPLSWLYGPLMPNKLERDKDQSRRLAGCNFEQAKALIDIFNPKNMFVYAMGLEPWLQYISSIKYTEESRPIKESNKTIDYCLSKGIKSERLFGEKVIEYTS